MQNFLKKQKYLNLEPQMGYLRTFGRILEFGKFEVANYKYDNSFFKICHVSKLRQKIKFRKFGTKNALFHCFWARSLKS